VPRGCARDGPLELRLEVDRIDRHAGRRKAHGTAPHDHQHREATMASGAAERRVASRQSDGRVVGAVRSARGGRWRCYSITARAHPVSDPGIEPSRREVGHPR